MTERRDAEIATPGTGTTETNPRKTTDAEKRGDKDTLIEDATTMTERRDAKIATPGTGTTETKPRNTTDAEKRGDKGTEISDGIRSVDFSEERNVGRQQGMTTRYRYRITEKPKTTAGAYPPSKPGTKEKRATVTRCTVITAVRKATIVTNAQAKPMTSSRKSTWLQPK